MRRPLRKPHGLRNEDIENYEETASYIVYIDGSNYVALNGSTGIEDARGTDASTIIQYAVDNIPTGGSIFLKAGTYSIKTQITVTGKMALIGEGMYSTILYVADGANCNVIYMAPTDTQQFLRLAEFQIFGNKANNASGTGILFDSVNGGDVWDVEIYRVWIYQMIDHGMDTDDLWGHKYYSLIIEGCTDSGFVLSEDANNGFFSGCRFAGNKQGITSTTNHFYRTTWIGCEIETNKEEGFYYNGEGCSFIGGSVWYNSIQTINSWAGIYIYAGADIAIIGTQIHGSNQHKYGINVNVGAGRIKVIGCSFLQNATADILDPGNHVESGVCDGWIQNAEGVTAVIADGATFAHGLSLTPTGCILTGTVAGDLISVSALGAANVTVAIKDEGGGAGTAQVLYWRAWF